MARTEELPAGAAASIAEQIGERLPQMIGVAPGSPPTLDSSFPVLVLGADAVQRPLTPGLADSTRRTALWHHQIRAGGRAQMFARSAEAPGARFTVNEVVRSELAENMDAAIDVIDGRFGDEAEVSVLAVPAFYLTAFLVRTEEQAFVVVADRPDRYSELEPQAFIPEADFIRVLRSLEPAQGIPRERPGATGLDASGGQRAAEDPDGNDGEMNA
jgi:hypothetical protein